MRSRKYLGPIIGAVLSLAFAATVLAGTSSGTVTNASPGWNTPVFSSISHTTFSIWLCSDYNSDTNAYYDWMHHWPIIPPTGTQLVLYPCKNTTTQYSYTWSASGTADYSVEYTHYNNGAISDHWQASY